ncbi:MAG: HNH endonuclease [Phycisphaeraceae bacterium]|nr:HNH endonuclease [Phycisphaeraceae bacterium]
MAISERDIKLLWGRAAGHCSAPGCLVSLLPLLDNSGSVVMGEMAHVIGRRPGSARNDSGAGEGDGYDNLILLCPNHHTVVDKAEADYPPATLRQWKAVWEARVSRRVLKRVSSRSDDMLDTRLWTYFNFGLVLKLHREHCADPPLGSLSRLRQGGIVDDDGLPRSGDGEKRFGPPRTVFETWAQDKARQLQQFYSGIVEGLIHETPPLDLDEVWGIRKLRSLLYPMAVVSLNRRCHFKTVRKQGENEERRVRCRAKGIEVVFQMDSWNVFSSSSLDLHFRGSTRTLALLLVRSVEASPGSGPIRLVVKTTPIALGAGFPPSSDRTPAIAWRKCESDEDEAF